MDKKLLEKVSLCALNRIFGYEPLKAHRIIDETGCASVVFSLSGNELRNLLGPYSRYASLLNDSALEESEKELDRIQSSGATFIDIRSEDYPELLRDCEDAPLGLYVRSADMPGRVFSPAASVSVVGTRDISSYGYECCRAIIKSLSSVDKKPLIVSGLAIGVDICAHRTALELGLPTVAVLPTGIDGIYPERHRSIADEIASREGCALVTDFPTGTSPQACTFLRRNRIIAGMSRATILVESKLRGGGMLTARMAGGYGRDVFTVPGRVDDLRSGGCNLLLREKAAEPVTDFDALRTALGLGGGVRRKKESLEEEVRATYSGIDPVKVEILVKLALLVKSRRGITIEDLALLAGLTYSETAGIIGLLESDGIVDTDLLQRCSIHYKIT